MGLALCGACQLSGPEQVRGQSLEKWLGRTGVGLNVLITNLRQRGAGGREVPRSVGQMTELVGRVPLKDIVRDTNRGGAVRDADGGLGECITRRRQPRVRGRG